MKLEGIIPALITPLNTDGKTVNERSAKESVLFCRIFQIFPLICRQILLKKYRILLEKTNDMCYNRFCMK